MIVVSDTTIVSNLFQVGLLQLLRQLYQEVVLPVAVADEVRRLDPNLIANHPWLRIESIRDSARVAALLEELDRGEAEALVLAQELRADWLLIDELKGRVVAQRFQLPYTGTLGVLLNAKSAGFLPSVKPTIHALQQVGAWYHDLLIDKVLRTAHEL